MLFHRENRWTDQIKIIQLFLYCFTQLEQDFSYVFMEADCMVLRSSSIAVSYNLQLSFVTGGISNRCNHLPSGLGKCCNAVKYSNLATGFISRISL